MIFNKDLIQDAYAITVQHHVNIEGEPSDLPSENDNEEFIAKEIIDNLPIDLVEVTGIPESMTPEEVIRFFENQDLSGGGTILHTIHDQDAYLLTFKSTEGRNCTITRI